MILTLRLKGFRRYADETIALGPGVCFIEGENNAGKTTLLYAIEYALFGRVTGHKTLSALMAPKSKQMGVELVLRGADGHRYRLQRVHVLPPRSRTSTIGHFTLKRSVQPIDAQVEEGSDPNAETYIVSSDFQDREEALALALQRALGLGRRFFDVAVYLRQGEITSILDGAPRELDIVLGVTSAVVAADEMRAMALEREKEASTLPVVSEMLRAMESDRETGRAQAEVIAKELVANAERQEALAGELAAIAEAQAAAKPLADAAARLERASAEATRAAQALEDARAMALATGSPAPPVDESRAAALVEREQGLEASRRALSDERRALDRERGDLAARIARREAHTHAGDGAACESCGQPIDAARASREVAGWTRELADVDARLAAITVHAARGEEDLAAVRGEARVLSEARARAEAVTARLAESEKLVARRTAAHEEALRTLDQAASAIRPLLDARETASVPALAEGSAAEIERTREALRTRRARAEAEEGVIREARERLEAERTSIARRHAQVEREHARVREACERLRELAGTATQLRTLSEAFSELQSLLRERAATALAKETLSIHQALQGADGDKRGELRGLRLDPDSYAVLVTPNDVGREVPASTAQGGGHRLLLGLALKLAIGRVVGRPPFLLLDEPTYGLDRARRIALLGRIASLGVTDQILLITHHETDGVVGRRVRVVRRGKESRTEQVVSA